MPSTHPHLSQPSQLIGLSHAALTELAHSLSMSHKSRISSLPDEMHASYSRATHEFEVSLSAIKGASTQSRLLRLSDAEFWLKKLSAISKVERERAAAIQGRIGNPANGKEPYCTNELYNEFMDGLQKRARRKKNASCSEALRSARKHQNGTYLIAKAQDSLAKKIGLYSTLITLTCTEIFHPCSKHYQGYSFREAHDHLNHTWRKITRKAFRHLKAGTDYFGIRATEVHINGCPHWHILIYSSKETAENLKDYVLAYCAGKKQISISPPDGLSGVSYLFKDSFAWRNENPADIVAALRQMAAISCAGVAKYQLIGENGKVSKINALKKSARSPEGCANTQDLACRLKSKQRGQARYTEQLEATIEALNGGTTEFSLIKQPRMNRYGDNYNTVVGIKSSEITPEQAFTTKKRKGWAVICNDTRIEFSKPEPHKILPNKPSYSSYQARAPPTTLAALKKSDQHHNFYEAPSPFYC